MESIIANAAQLSAVLLHTSEEEYDNLAGQVVVALRKLSSPDVAVAATLLQTIDPATHTIPYLWTLASLIDTTISAHKAPRSLPSSLLPEGELWTLITNSLLAFDRIQVRYAGPQLMKIIETVFAGAEQSANFIPAIQLLQHVIRSIDPSSSTLSITHYYYVKLCLHARAYVEATLILDDPIYHVPTTESTKALEKRLAKYTCSATESSVAYINTSTGLSGKITTRTYLEYFFMGALCYIATGQWKKAHDFLEVVLVAPTHQNVASLIMLEAYRKLVLINLVVDGKSYHSPRATGGNAIKHIRTLAKPYESIADAFKSNKLEVLLAEIQEGSEMWQNEGNYGLILGVVAAFRKFSVIRLGKTYAALPIEDVAAKTSQQPADAQETFAYVQALIEAGELQARITPSQRGGLGTVHFSPSTAAAKTESEIERELAQKTVDLKTLMKHITDYDHQIEVNKDYLEWLLKAKKARDQDKKAGSAIDSGYPIGRPPAQDFPDEEMMEEYV